MDTPLLPQQIDILKTGTISKRGGARIGAGRKPRLQFEARELFNMAVDENWDLLMEKVWEAVKNGDRDMIKFVLEQKIGKPAQFLNIQKQETQVHHNIFYNPKIREATRIYEEKLKGELLKGVIKRNEEDRED